MKQTVACFVLDGVNVYLLRTEEGFLLIDTGGPMVMDKKGENRRREKLRFSLDACGCDEKSLRLVLLTHGDADHAANAAWLRETYHAPVALHKADARLVESLSPADYIASFQYRSPVMRLAFKAMRGVIRRVAETTAAEFEVFTPDLWLDEDFDLAAYGFDGQILHLPGHTGGSVGLLTSDGCLFAGDVFANLKKPQPAPNALDFRALDASIEKLKACPIQIVYPGHGKFFLWKELHI